MTEPTPPAPPVDRPARWPIGLFPAVMGLFGLSLAVQASLAAMGASPALSWPFVLLGLAGLMVAVGGYGRKFLRHRAAVVADWNTPLNLVFFPAIAIATMLAGTALVPLLPGLARWIWILGAVAQAGLSLGVLSAWTGQREFQLAQVSPAWFIPAVGNIVAPIGGGQLGFEMISWVFMAAGLAFWLMLLPLVFLRLLTLGPPPAPLRPTLAILVAPPSVGAAAWMSVTGTVDTVAVILLGMGLSFALLVAVRMPIYLKQPFGLPHWGLTFPWAALAAACIRIGSSLEVPALVWLGNGLTLALAGLIAWLLVQTGRAFRDGRLFAVPPAAPATT
ncbi:MULTISPECIES: SLAC1 anion channel family protein [unclassified Meridianimarinicoccus]|uniref:SLAC1 anion channel family protein n=1 Tax=unclassified Meridianimarinicoccus TaxID=2923344 RepID=UPI0018685535|nr:SLAC1 anion channel family protein [Fluviibacterium sp. MJW13]